MKISFYDWCLKHQQEYLLELWDYDKNTVRPDDVCITSKVEYYFKCPLHKHESSLIKISNLTGRIRTKTICSKCNSFAQYLIDEYGEDAMCQYWDNEKNIINPWEISRGSKCVVYLICQNKPYHENYPITPKDFIRGRRCPYCRGLKIHPFDSFAACCNRKLGDGYINKIWDDKLNIVNPWEIAPNSNIYVYLRCTENSNHPSYRIFLPNVFKTKYHCAICASEHNDSILQQSVVAYIVSQYAYNLLHEFGCTIKCKNQKTNRWLRYDNEVLLPGNMHLIIEVHGIQHFVADCGYNNKRAKKLNITPEEVLTDQQWRDEIKRRYALEQGYFYLAIPYWTEKDQSYKQLIDDKIHEILSTV